LKERGNKLEYMGLALNLIIILINQTSILQEDSPDHLLLSSIIWLLRKYHAGNLIVEIYQENRNLSCLLLQDKY